MKGFKDFGLLMVGFTVVILLLTVIFKGLAPDNAISSVLLFIPLFYFLVVLISQVILYRISSGSDQKYTQVFLVITVVRFLLYLAVVIAYSFLRRSDAVQFIISFFVYYFLYTVFETWYMNRELRSKKN